MSLLRGDGLTCHNGLKVKQPTINEIYDDIGLDNWWKIVNLFTVIPYDYMVALYDMGITYKEISNYDLFIIIYNSFQNKEFIEALNYLFSEDFNNYRITKNPQNGEYVIVNSKGKTIIDMLTYKELSDFFKKINSIEKKEKYNFGNEASMKKYIAKEKKKLKKKALSTKKDDDWLEDIISSVCWSSENSYTLEEIYNLKIYQLMNGLKRINKSRDVYYKTMAVYNGHIDKNKIKDSDLNWNGKL